MNAVSRENAGPAAFAAWVNGEVEKQNLSITQLAYRADLSHSVVSTLLNHGRRVTEETVEKICTALGFPAEIGYAVAYGVGSSDPWVVAQSKQLDKIKDPEKRAEAERAIQAIAEM